ncbi:MAG: amino acid racemase [Gallicola sp.]|nr:amino acid racemase [Gallicola sp.]
MNKTIKNKMGGLHSGKIILISVDFAEIENYQTKGQWDKSAELLTEAALKLQGAGADFIVICTNTMHKVAPEIQDKIQIPLLHIADATLEGLKGNNIKKAALLGTKFTMKEDFYKDKITEQGINVLIPSEEEMAYVNKTIYEELCLGKIREESKEEFIRIVDRLQEEGAEGVILGCTEIGLLIQQKDTRLPVFDTTKIHAYKAAVEAMED